jgi:hypothetical protein
MIREQDGKRCVSPLSMVSSCTISVGKRKESLMEDEMKNQADDATNATLFSFTPNVKDGEENMYELMYTWLSGNR